jgi:hypothetical protein
VTNVDRKSKSGELRFHIFFSDDYDDLYWTEEQVIQGMAMSSLHQSLTKAQKGDAIAQPSDVLKCFKKH